ncbi:MAG: hypothetical protein ACRCX2_01210 [Paraclostridium sp.]
MDYNYKDFEISSDLRLVIHLEDIEKTIKNKFKDFEDFRDKFLKPRGWKGRCHLNGTNLFQYPHVTKLTHPYIENGKETFGMKIDIDLSQFENVPVFNEVKKLVKSDDFDEKMKNDIIYCFYDIEVTEENAFTGIKLDGFDFCFYPIYETVNLFIKLHNYYKSLNKMLVFIAYNDPYDGNVLIRASQIKNGFLADYLLISCTVIRELNKISKYKGEYTFDPIFNPLSKYIYTFDAMQDLIFNVNSDKQARFKDGLKYECGKFGIFYEHHIGTDLFEYNKTDVLNTEKIFYLRDGTSKIKTILSLFERSNFIKRNNGRPFAISSKLALGVYIKEAFPDGILEEDFKCPEVREDYYNFMMEKYKIVELWSEKEEKSKQTPELLYSRNQSVNLSGGYGGIHSKTKSIKMMSTDKFKIYDIDFASFYPSIMIDENTEFIKESSKEILRSILEQRLKLKESNDKINSDALKLFLNSIYGKMKSMDLREPNPGRLIPLVAKCKMIKLLRSFDKLFKESSDEDLNYYNVIDVNTDGIIISLPIHIDVIKHCNDFVHDSVYVLEVKNVEWIVYKSSGNYILQYEDSSKKYKGSWIESSSTSLDETNHAYNILNMGDIISEYINNSIGIKPVILCRYTNKSSSDGNSMNYKCDVLPFKINYNVDILVSNFQSEHMLDGETIVDEEMGKLIAINKLKQCKSFEKK